MVMATSVCRRRNGNSCSESQERSPTHRRRPESAGLSSYPLPIQATAEYQCSPLGLQVELMAAATMVDWTKKAVAARVEVPVVVVGRMVMSVCHHRSGSSCSESVGTFPTGCSL